MNEIINKLIRGFVKNERYLNLEIFERGHIKWQKRKKLIGK